MAGDRPATGASRARALAQVQRLHHEWIKAYATERGVVAAAEMIGDTDRRSTTVARTKQHTAAYARALITLAGSVDDGEVTAALIEWGEAIIAGLGRAQDMDDIRILPFAGPALTASRKIEALSATLPPPAG